MASSSRRTAPAGRWKAGPSTRSATAACTPMRSPSTDGSCRTTASSAARQASARGFYYHDRGGLRERPAADRRPGRRDHAATYRGGRAIRPRSLGVRAAGRGEYQLTQVKLARMAIVIQAARQFAYTVARMMAKGEGALEASMVKAYVCRAAEWVTRQGDADPRRLRLRRGVHGQPASSSTHAGALDLRGGG